jgi:gliding motility-associated lipoprotein GldH
MNCIRPSLLLIFVIALIFTSCNGSKTIFEEHQKFGEDYYWYQKDAKTFVIDVQENRHPFEFVLAFRCASSYLYDKAILQITETDPAGNKVRHDVDIQIRDAKGEFIGEKGFDIIDIEHVLDAKKEFPVFGKYTYDIRQVMPEIDPLQFCMEVGLIVRDVEGSKK